MGLKNNRSLPILGILYPPPLSELKCKSLYFLVDSFTVILRLQALMQNSMNIVQLLLTKKRVIYFSSKINMERAIEKYKWVSEVNISCKFYKNSGIMCLASPIF